MGCVVNYSLFYISQDQDKLAKFFSHNYKKDMLEKELSVKGWNWGRADFNGATLSFEVANNAAFEIPLHNVSQCTTGKNEVTLEFHQVCVQIIHNTVTYIDFLHLYFRMMMRL